jgi:hypothetical protein
VIRGLELEPAVEARVWDAFQGWADHFRRRFADDGVPWLIEQYAAVIASLETQSCSHGPGGQRQTGEAWQSCCGTTSEYLNDISIRDALQVILKLAPPEATRSIAADTAALDDRLYALYRHRPTRVGSWWRNGLPQGVVA